MRLAGRHQNRPRPDSNHNAKLTDTDVELLLTWSPVDALIELKVGGRLRRPIPVGCPARLGCNTLTGMRIARIPHGDARACDIAM